MPLLGYQLRAARQQISLGPIALFEANLERVNGDARETDRPRALLMVSGA